jgi:hypothetical protein
VFCAKGFRPLTDEQNPITLGEHLKKRRIEPGLFQKEVAKSLDVDEFAYLGVPLEQSNCRSLERWRC